MSKIKFYFVNKILRVSFALSNAFRKEICGSGSGLFIYYGYK